MLRFAALGCIAVLPVLGPIAQAQTPALSLNATGASGTYTFTASYTTSPSQHPITGSVSFEDTSYSNTVIATAPFSSLTSVMQVPIQTMVSSDLLSNAVSGDFDGDGKTDLLFIDQRYALDLLKGNGNGTFQAVSIDTSATMMAKYLVAADFNGDGKLDIATSGFSDTTTTAPILIRLGNGDGTFQAPTSFTDTFPVYYGQLSLHTGDFNGDGKLDLFSNNGSSSNLYLGHGDGTFAAALSSFPASEDTGDFNHDGLTDVLNTTYVLLGQSGSSFQKVSFPVQQSIPSGAAVADFNHDGNLDVAAGGSLYLGNGDGTFQAPVNNDVVPDPDFFFWYAYQTLAKDLNGDGNADISIFGYYAATRFDAMYNNYTLYVVTLFGKGDGTFAAKDFRAIEATPGAVPQPLSTAGDFTGDGVLDIVNENIVNIAQTSVTVMPALNTFIATAPDTAVTPTGTHLVRAHYSGDSNYPAATSSTVSVQGSTATSTLTLTSSTATSTYYSPVTFTATVTPCAVGAYSCDTNLVTLYDGSTSLGSSYPISGVTTFSFKTLSQGAHTLHAVFAGSTYLSSSTSNTVTLNVGPPAGIVGSLHLDSSGSADSYTLLASFTSPVRAAAPTGNISFIDLTSSNAVLATASLGTASYALIDSTTSSTPVIDPTSTAYPIPDPVSIYAGDFNNDGNADIIYGTGSDIVTWKGTGHNSFLINSTQQGRDSGFAVADFNNDGNLDVAALDMNQLQIYLGNGDGTFNHSANISKAAYGGSNNVFTGDFNGDSKKDLIFDKNDGTYPLLLGNGNGTFQAPVSTTINATVAADFNQDGRTDLFTTNGVYLGQTNATFTLVAPTSGTYPAGMLTADFNNDGKPDVLTADNAVLLGNGDGTFQTPISVDFATGYTGTFGDPSYFTGDFNGDGKADLGVIVWSYDNSGADMAIVWTFGDGTGHFSNRVVSTRYQAPDHPAFPTHAVDFSNDGADDFVGVFAGAYSVTPLIWQTKTQYIAQVSNISVSSTGDHSVYAAYPGDTTYINASSNFVTLQGRNQPAVTLSINPNPATAGSPITFTATLSPYSNFSLSTDGEPILFYDGQSMIGSGTLASGVAQFTTSALSSGTHSITASYEGDSVFKPATSAAASLQINSTSYTITWSTPAAITYGTALSATQLNASTSIAGSFAYTPAAGAILDAGSHTLSTTFTPTNTALYSASSQSTTLVVNKATPAVAITQTSPGTPGVGVGISATFRATLSIAYGSPSGSVLFYDSATLIGTGTISGGVASITTTFTTTGTHPITGVYSGDANFNAATSPVFNEGVVAYGLTFSATPTPLTIKRGQTGTVTITGTPTGNYTGSITFSCAGLPAFTTCGFAPSTLTFSGDNQPKTTVLTISTNVATAALSATSNLRFAALFGLPLLAIALRKRRKLQQALLALFAAVLLLPATGCSSNPQTPSTGITPTGSQTVTINALTTVSGGSSQSLSLNIVIEP